MTSKGRQRGRSRGGRGFAGVVPWLALVLGLTSGVAANAPPGAPLREAARAVTARAMPDGREWMVKNLAYEAAGSFCYAGQEINCRLYGRLYTLSGARQACAALGGGWRLPSEAEWRRLVASLGGDVAATAGRNAYHALVVASATGFEAVHGGRRTAEGEYEGLAARGFYWADEPGEPSRASYYGFRREGATVARHDDGDPRMGLSVRCLRTPVAAAR